MVPNPLRCFLLGLLVVIPLVLASPLPQDVSKGLLIDRRAVSREVYDDLVFYMQYASTAYTDTRTCSHPNDAANELVLSFNSGPNFDTQGFIVRDDKRKEIVVAFRGSTTPIDFMNDFTLIPVPLISPGVRPPTFAWVHAGFVAAYNAVAPTIIDTVRAQLATYPSYTLVTTGHSLGGALSSLGGISLKQNFPTKALRLYTYGAPRVGNARFANWVNQQVGIDNLYRIVHTDDTVPRLPPVLMGYEHHATEYWQNPDPSTPDTVKKCVGNEDTACSASLGIPFVFINSAHLTYLGNRMGTPFCF